MYNFIGSIVSIRRSHGKKKKSPSKLSRAIRRTWDTTMDLSGMRVIIRKIDTLAEWEEPETLNESLTADVISGIPFIGLRRSISQFKKNKTATNVFDGVAEFLTVTGSTVAMIFPSNTILYVKRNDIPKKYQKKIRYI